MQELSCLGALQFRLISEGFFCLCCFSQQLGKDWGGISHPTWSEEEWGNHQFGDPHHQWGRREGFDMVMVFCHPNQTKIEAYDVLSTLPQCNSLELSVVVVGRYSNTPCIPWGMSHSLYLDVGTLSGSSSSTQFPLDRLCLCQLIPFSRTEVLLQCEEGKRGWKCTPIFQRFCRRVQRNTTFLIQFLCWSPCQPLLQI